MAEATEKRKRGRPHVKRRKQPINVYVDPVCYDIYKAQPKKVAFIEQLIREFAGIEAPKK